MGEKAGSGGGTTVITETDDDFEDDDAEQELDADGNPVEKDGDEEFDAARAKKTIDAQRANEKKLKKDLATARAKVKEFEEKDLPEKERHIKAAADAEERAANAEKALKKATVRTEALEIATTLRFASPTLAHRLLDEDDIQWDDDEPKNIKSLLQDILRENPELKGNIRRKAADDDEDEDEDGADAGAGRSKKGGSGFNMNREIRRASGRAG